MNWEGLCILEKILCYFCQKSIVIYASKDCVPSLWTTAVSTIFISSKLWVGVDEVNDGLTKILCVNMLQFFVVSLEVVGRRISYEWWCWLEL
jgi:hypothetical protein